MRTAVFSVRPSRRRPTGVAAPRCQRTFRRLSAAAEDGAGNSLSRWICPFCEEREVYETVVDADLRDYASWAYAQCVRDFGAPPDKASPIRLLTGLHPECVYEITQRRYDLYLQRGSDAFQLRLQIGHEMFHRVCSLGAVFHWSHEMLACLVSVRLLRASDDPSLIEYADRVRDHFQRDSDVLTVPELLAADLRVPPADTARAAGIYGRAFALGEELIDAAGWSALRRLARWNVGATAPDVAGWMDWLRRAQPDAAERCTQILNVAGTLT